MAFLSSSGSSMVDMNITPLVDVMLVLLVIFMVTVPAISHPIPMDLPRDGESKAIALELLPEPDSPTIASTSPRLTA